MGDENPWQEQPGENPPHNMTDRSRSHINSNQNKRAMAIISKARQTDGPRDGTTSLYELQEELCNWAILYGFQLDPYDKYAGCVQLTVNKDTKLYLQIYVAGNYLQAWNITNGATTILDLEQGKGVILNCFKTYIRNNHNPHPETMRTEILTNFHHRILNLEERLAGGGVTLEG
jgi:hypothetical protein